jgi:hypothetical protein
MVDVTGIWTGNGMDQTGRPIDRRQRFVDTWVKAPASGPSDIVVARF